MTSSVPYLSLGSLGSEVSFTIPLHVLVLLFPFLFQEMLFSVPPYIPCTHTIKSLTRSKTNFSLQSQLLAQAQMEESMQLLSTCFQF
jgi:hypothetical protein